MYLHSMYIQQIMTDWKIESGIKKHLILWKYDRKNKELNVYTDTPGPLIGIRGSLIYKYEDKLKKFDKEITINLVETEGIV